MFKLNYFCKKNKLQMKLSFLLLTLVLSIITIQAQDLLVKQNNDSINCRITSISEDQISYYYKASQNNIEIGNVKSYIIKYFIDLPREQRLLKENTTRELVPQKNISIGFKGSNIKLASLKNDTAGKKAHFLVHAYAGVGKTLGSVHKGIDKSLISYYEDLKFGTQLGLGVFYYTKKNWGGGLMYNLFKCNNSLNGIVVTDSLNNTRYGGLSDDINITSFGFTLARKIPISRGFDMEFYTSLIFMNYYNQAVVIDSYDIKGSTLGQNLGMALSINLTPNLCLELRSVLYIGAINEFFYEDEQGKKWTYKLEDNTYESLNRLDVSLGLKIKI